MFTGLIRDIGEVAQAKHYQDGTRLTISTRLNTNDMDIGASVACSGCCLTVVSKNQGTFDVDVSPETLSKTHIGRWENGTKINLEPSLKAGDEIGGHYVSGHVDGLVTLQKIEDDGNSKRLYFECGPEYAKFVAQKGSVAIDGISLTVNGVHDTGFDVAIIPHTLEHTTLQYNKVVDSLHFEVDILARYVLRYTELKD